VRFNRIDNGTGDQATNDEDHNHDARHDRGGRIGMHERRQPPSRSRAHGSHEPERHPFKQHLLDLFRDDRDRVQQLLEFLEFE
jgi:hypothetical protein